MQETAVVSGAQQWAMFGLLSSIGVSLVSLLGYLLNRKTDNRAIRTARDEQVRMHEQNSQKLDQLLEFRLNQERLNDQRDEQVSALKSMASTTAESLKLITSGLDRRVEMLEDELRDRRRNG